MRENDYQILLTYSGIFTYALERGRWLIDTGRTLFILPGQDSWEEHPVKDVGHATVSICPSQTLLEELRAQPRNRFQTIFGAVSRPSSMRLRILTQQLLNLTFDADTSLLKDEWVIRVLGEAFELPCPEGRHSKLVDRTKQLLHARWTERLVLDQIANEVGASAIYLTQEFTRCEGTPLYRYQLQLRLTRALEELRRCDDITGLALDLGFSSHSHFTCAFRKAFGLTPSEYRSNIGSRHFLYQ